jgi:hypothetical protein
MLEERLVFRESEPVRSVPGHLGRSGFAQTGSDGFEISRECENAFTDTGTSRSAIGKSCTDFPPSVNSTRAEQNHQQGNMFANVQSLSHTSYQQRLAHSSSFRTPQVQSGASSHPQFRPTKSQAELDIDALFEEPYSQNQGTESPYRVESPSGRASGVSSLQRSPQRWNDNGSLTTPLSSLEKDPFQLDRTFSNTPSLNHSTQPSASCQSYLSDSGYFSEGQPPSASSSQSQSQPHNDNFSDHTRQSTVQQSPTVKSFLPVNKSTDNASSHIVKDSGFSNSLMSEGATVSQKRLALGNPPPHDNTFRGYNTQSHNIPQHHNITQSSQATHNHPHHQHLPSTKHHQFDFEQFPNTNKNQEIEMGNSSDSASRKRKANADGAPRAKKPKTDKADKPKRVPKVKEKKPEPVGNAIQDLKPILTVSQAKHRLGQDLWMRILEFTPPSFLKKARILSKEFKGWVDDFNSIYVNQRKENYGQDMPDPPRGLTERQYNDLLGGKGCLEPGCTDKLASRTHWSWAQRWCWDCWKAKIEREDRVLKLNHAPHGRNLVAKLLECIPVGMHDSFLKPHDFIEDLESRPRGAPRLYRYYLKEDVKKIIEKYDALIPAPFVENPEQTPEERASARAAWQEEMDKLDDKKAEFLADGKAKNDEYMKIVQKIESLVKKRRDVVAKPYNDNRQARRELFTRRAREDLPHIPTSFVESTKAYKAATRIFRDGGTERGWQTLKPKIEKEFEKSKSAGAAANLDLDVEEDEEIDQGDDGIHSAAQVDLARTAMQNAGRMTGQELREHQMRQRQYNAQQLRAQRELMLGSGPSNMLSALSSMQSMQSGFTTMQQVHQHQNAFSAGMSRASLSYDNFGSALFQRQQQLMNRSGPPTNFDSYPSFQSMTQSSSTQNNSNGFQSSTGQLPRISISSLLGDGPSAPPKAPQYNPFG